MGLALRQEAYASPKEAPDGAELKKPITTPAQSTLLFQERGTELRGDCCNTATVKRT